MTLITGDLHLMQSSEEFLRVLKASTNKKISVKKAVIKKYIIDEKNNSTKTRKNMSSVTLLYPSALDIEAKKLNLIRKVNYLFEEDFGHYICREKVIKSRVSFGIYQPADWIVKLFTKKKIVRLAEIISEPYDARQFFRSDKRSGHKWEGFRVKVLDLDERELIVTWAKAVGESLNIQWEVYV